MPVDAVSYLYAAIVTGGGIFGYVKAGEFSFVFKCLEWKDNRIAMFHRLHSISWCRFSIRGDTWLWRTLEFAVSTETTFSIR